MSTYNRINWNTSKNLLTRENLNKMSEAIVTCAPKTEVGYIQQDIKSLISTSEVIKTNSNTVVINDSMKTETYVVGPGKNLITVPATVTNHRLINHLNPLPSGEYIFYIYGNANNAVPVTITSRRSRLEDDPTNGNNLLTVFNDYVNCSYWESGCYNISAPNGIDYITIEIDENDATLFPVLLRKEDFTSVIKIDYNVVPKAENIMPFPYLYEYWRHNPQNLNNGSTTINELKFTDLEGGGVKVERADPSNGDVTEDIKFYLHCGTEVEYPAGEYTVSCEIYTGAGNVWGGRDNAYLGFLARWEDGNNNSYYQDSVTPGSTTKAIKIYRDTPITFNAFNGIKSIIVEINISKNFDSFPTSGLIFKPALVRGTEALTVGVNDTIKNNTVYKYGSNLLRPRTPELYNSETGQGNGPLENNTANGITIVNKGGGYFTVNGTATANTTFVVNAGRYYMSPIGTLRFGSLSDNAPDNMELRITVKRKNSAAVMHKYKKDSPVSFESTADNPMIYYSSTRIYIPKGAVCNNVLISWQMSLEDENGNMPPFERFEMPRGYAGNEPGVFENYGEKNFTFIGNPEYNLLVKSWRNKISDDKIFALEDFKAKHEVEYANLNTTVNEIQTDVEELQAPRNITYESTGLKTLTLSDLPELQQELSVKLGIRGRKNLFYFTEDNTYEGVYMEDPDDPYDDEVADKSWSFEAKKDTSKIIMDNEAGDYAGGFPEEITYDLTELINTLDQNETYTISASANFPGNGIGISYANLSFDDNITLIHFGYAGEIDEITSYTFKPSELINKKMVLSNIEFADFGSEILIQIEKGTTATEYEDYDPWVEASGATVTKQGEDVIYTADENGVVKGIVSSYPTTILEAEADDVFIKVEYVKNINEDLNIIPSQNPNTSLVIGANITDVLRYTKQELTAEQKAQIIENLGLADFIRDMIQQNAESIAQNYLDTTIAEEGTW